MTVSDPTPQPAPLNVRDSLDDVVAVTIRPVTLGAAVALGLLALLDALTVRSPHIVPLAVAEGFLGICLLGVFVLLRRWPLPMRLANPYLLLLVNLCLGVCTAFLVFVPNLLETVNVIILMIGQGMLFTSRRWFAAGALSTFAWWGVGGWLQQAWRLPLSSASWTMLSLYLVVALCMSTLVFFVRRDSFLHLVALRQREAQQRAQLEVALAQLQNQNQAKTRFVDSVSHELRTPLTSILGYTEFLEEEMFGPLNSQQHHFVSQIHKGVQRLQDLVDDLLDYTRIETGLFTLQIREADFGAKVREVLESVRPQSQGARLELSARLPAAPVTLPMDGQRIEQVLLNLVSNAIKFTPEGGSIVIEARVEADTLRCAVVDTGVGIEPEDQAKLFERFAQLECGTRRGSTGLGLSISKAIVEAHGGEIGVDSAPNQGSSFWFRLPLDRSGEA